MEATRMKDDRKILAGAVSLAIALATMAAGCATESTPTTTTVPSASAAAASVGGPAGGPAGGASSCQDAFKAADGLVHAAIARNLKCSQDSDCVAVAKSTKCFDQCTGYVNAAGVADVKAAEAQADTSYCGAYEQQHCPRAIPPCMAPLPGKCMNGSCGG
jgi:hypothetical protein